MNKKKTIALWSAGIAVWALLVLCGFYFGKSPYQSETIALKYMDRGESLKSFYCVEVVGKKFKGEIDVYAKIHIGGLSSGYYHDCGKIGTAKTWQEARSRFRSIRIDKETLWIGDSFSLKKSQYENHR